jgi:hypothetical protein
MSYERYRAAGGVSKSMLDILWHQTPLHLRTWLDTPADDETEAARFGVILHRALLEPDTYLNGFYTKPEGMNFATKEGRAWKEEHTALPLVTFNEAKQITGMIDSLHTHPYAKRVLVGETEQNVFVTDSNGLLRKSRLDILNKGNVLPDVKTCTAADLESVEKAINNYRYHVQGAYYLDNCRLIGIEKELWFLIFIEKDPPYAVHVVRVLADVLEAGRRLYQRDLHLYRTCLESNEWPGYELGFTDAGLPEYAMRQLERMSF